MRTATLTPMLIAKEGDVPVDLRNRDLRHHDPDHHDPDHHDLRHHGDREVGPGLVDLTVNVRRPAPPVWLRDVLIEALDGVAAYPDTGAATTAVAHRHGRTREEVLVTAGGAEAFTLVARALCPGTDVGRAVVVHPQFTEPEVALAVAGHRVDRLLLGPQDGYALDPARVPQDADLVVVGNPTNPTSVLHPLATLRRLVRPGRVLVVDEAFMDTVPGEPESLAALRLPGVIVLRSLTKTWGLAGVRAGYLLAEPALVRRLAEVQPPWSVSSLALAATVACCSPSAVAEADRAAVRSVGDREHLVRRLQGVAPVAAPPAAPFVLLHVPQGAAVREGLRERGFAVRRGDTFPGLGPNWLRVAVRDRGVTDSFVDALTGVLRRGMT